MADAGTGPLHCPACGSPEITRPPGALGQVLRFLVTLSDRHCRHCGFQMEFLNPSQLEALRKHHGVTGLPAAATDSL